jgi:hypothetical protein
MAEAIRNNAQRQERAEEAGDAHRSEEVDVSHPTIQVLNTSVMGGNGSSVVEPVENVVNIAPHVQTVTDNSLLQENPSNLRT